MKNLNLIFVSILLVTLGACSQAVGTDVTEPDGAAFTAEVQPTPVTAILPPAAPVCGNGVTEIDEECDGDMFVTRNYCEDYGFDRGQLSCTNCMIGTSG